MATAAREFGTIAKDAVYSLTEFSRISGLGETALRKMRRQGLTIRRVGSRSFVYGADFHDYLERYGKIVLPDGSTCDPDNGIGAQQNVEATT